MATEGLQVTLRAGILGEGFQVLSAGASAGGTLRGGFKVPSESLRGGTLRSP